MKKLIAIGYVLLVGMALSGEEPAQDFQVREISGRVSVVTDADAGDKQLVIQSEKGLAVFNTFWSGITAKKFREAIAKGLKRSDFVYTLNLVDRLDLFGGNAVYKDTTIIGHASFLNKYRGKEKEVTAEIRQLIEMWREKEEISRQRLETWEKGSEKALAEQQWMKTCKQRADELEQGFSLLLPQRIYDNDIQIDLNDLTLKLIWFGKAGNYNGMTVVVVPEEKLAIIPGFILHAHHLAPYPHGQYAELDVPRWIAVLEEILEGENAVERVLCDMTELWTRERAHEHLDYIRRLWNRVKAAEAAGKDLPEIQDQLSLEREFAFVKNMKVYQERGDQWLRPQHQSHVRVFFLQHKKMASELLKNAGQDSLDEAITRLRKLRESNSGFYFDEGSFNFLGYGLMNAGKISEALNVFKFNVELFPRSANALDSLGEAWLKSGNKELAIENYKKSLALNPENDNAKKMLEQLQPLQSGAEIFAPGVISLPGRVEFCLALSPDENEAFFAVRKAPGQCEIRRTERKGGAWQPSVTAPFSGVHSDLEPTFSPDGRRLFFSSNRPLADLPGADGFNLWRVERQGDGWSTPQPLPAPINGPGDQWRASQGRSGNLYYSSRGLWACPFADGKAGQPLKLFDPRSPQGLIGGHAFVSPDEDFILTAWMDGPGHRGGWDLYVSFRDDQGNWSPSVNLGDAVNTPAGEDFPLLSPSGRDLYFLRHRKSENGDESGDIYRIDAGFLHALKQEALDLSASEQGFPRLSGPYLGQKPPGTTPEIFAPGIVSTDAHEGSSGFVMGGTAFLFQRFVDRDCHTYITTRKGDPWSPPERIPFWKELIHNGDFVIAPNSHTLLYQVKQERAGRLESNIWEVRLKEDGWGPRSALPAPINTEYDESYASRAANGNLYFFSNRPGGEGQFDLYMAECKHGGYADAINLQELNSAHHEWDPFVAPDESYLVFCSTRPGGLGQDDLYVSFRDRQGRWLEPIHLDDRFNSPQSENRPYVTPDGRFLFFTSSREGSRDVYWVDARIIEEIKARALK